MWSSAAVAHLLQGSPCCVFRDGILHSLVVTSDYLSYCCLSIISNQSAHSSLTSDINKAFSSTQLLLTGYFLFFGPFSVNPRDGCAWKSPVDQQRFELQQVVFTTSRCLNALSCCHLIGLQFVLPSNWTGVPNKVAGECVYIYIYTYSIHIGKPILYWYVACWSV